MDRIASFNEYRDRMNEIILSEAPIEVKRFLSLDTQMYQDGALPAKTKELLGLACSMVLRCDDCVTYHMQQCVKMGVTDEELWETMSIALIIAGSIIIPHLRRAAENMKEMKNRG